MLKTEEEKTAAMRECDFELTLNERQLCDVELLMQGGFSPLNGYMCEENYNSVVNDLKLKDGLIFSLVSVIVFLTFAVQLVCLSIYYLSTLDCSVSFLSLSAVLY